MSLSNIYQSFLATPNPDALANDATLNYITTLTTFTDSGPIVKHLTSQQRALKKNKEKVLCAIENSYAVYLEIETTLEFVTGGGAYLPNLDDNFLTDRVVIFPIFHTVHFDATQKIQQIRVHWDQGSLLKSLDVIGSRGRNWPIHDGKDQARLISSSIADQAESTKKALGGMTIGDKQTNKRNPTPDPHRSLSLFSPREEDEEERPSYASPAAARGSAKPPPRDYGDLFVGNDSDASPDARQRNASPKKSDAIAPKGGAGRNYQPSRLFNTDEVEATNGSPEKLYKSNPKKYDHFEFADGHDDEPIAQQPKKSHSKTKHQSQWDFEDFATPAKADPKIRGQDVRHWGNEDDVVADSPIKKPSVPKPRRDARPQFEFQDDGVSSSSRPAGHPRGQGTANTSASLYQNNLYGEGSGGKSPERRARGLSNLDHRHKDFDPHFDMAGAPPTENGDASNKPLANVTNLNDRRKDFDPHFQMTDESPGLGVKSASEINRPIPESRNKAIRGMEAQWEATDASPAKKKENRSPVRGTGASKGKENMGIKTGGDGMGGRKGTTRGWGFGDDSGNEEPVKPAGRGKTQNHMTDGLWDF